MLRFRKNGSKEQYQKDWVIDLKEDILNSIKILLEILVACLQIFIVQKDE